MIRNLQRNLSALAKKYEIIYESYLHYDVNIKFLQEKERLVLLTNNNCKVCHGRGFYYEKFKSKSGEIIYKDKDCYLCYKYN